MKLIVIGVAFVLMQVVIFLAIVGVTMAQQAASPDRRDYMLSSLQEQRNAAADREALCRADFSSAIGDASRQRAALELEVADLKRRLAESERKGAASPSP